MRQVVEKANEPYYRLTFADDDGEPGCGETVVPMFAPNAQAAAASFEIGDNCRRRAGQLGVERPRRGEYESAKRR